MIQNNSTITFNDETIQRLFGFEDAESEPIERLKEFFFKKDTYERVTSELPVRILVGHKGTGKSALFKIAMSEEIDRGNLPILIKPDDIAELGREGSDFLLKIRQWKIGLLNIIGTKVLEKFNLSNPNILAKFGQKGLKVVKFLIETISSNNVSVHLSETEQQLMRNFLERKKIIIYIDDLDRGWQGKKEDINRISALLNAIRDLANDNEGLYFKISLRSDVYYLVRTSDESTDKIEGAVVWYKWTNHEILVLLIKRVLTYFGKQANEASLMKTEQKYLCTHLDAVFDKNFYGYGKWANIRMYKVLMSLIRKRPRDLVKLCSLAAQQAYAEKSDKIRTQHLQAIFEEYSQGRVQDTINEYKSELPNIEKLIWGMKPNKKEKRTQDSYVYTTQQLKDKIRNIKQQCNFVFATGRVANEQDLAQFLYKINFITARKTLSDGEIQRKYFEENRYLNSSFVDFGYDWEVHPAFRWALQPDDITSIFNNLDLSSDNTI